MSHRHSGKTRAQGLRAVMGGFLLVLAGLVYATAEAAPPPQANLAAAARDLWTPGEVRFLKHWLMIGPVDGDLTNLPADLIAAAPAPGAPQTVAGKTLIWQPQFSWTDLIDLPSTLNSKTYRGTAASPEMAFAATTIDRDEAGEAVISIGSDQPLRLWLNGKEVSAVKAPRTFLFDQDRVPVHLQKGENRLLVGFVHRSGPWRFALRLLRPGQVITPVAEITPSLAADARGALSIRTDITPDNPGAPVHVAAVAPGGSLVAQSDAARGETVRFDTSAWPEGPYEIRLTTRTAWGDERVVHLPWYKGDARIAAQRLRDAVESAPQGLAGDTARMLGDLVRDRLGDNPLTAPDDAWPLVHSALMEYAELQGAGNGPVRQYGFVRLAYTDEVDGSTQFCLSYLPPHYDPKQAWPMVVMLHGFNPANPPYVRWWSVDTRHDDAADRHNVIFVEPLGRGNAQYLGIGEKDVLRCIAEAKKRFTVDEDRVYLAGESMGGSGTWLIASHHPELFAAAAPFFGGWDYRILPGGGFDNPKADQLPERFTGEYQSSFAAAESLSHLPLFVTHGDSDQTVPVDFTHLAVTMLQRWNYDLRYEEIPGRGHEDLDLRDRAISWLLTHRRGPAPRDVHIRAVELDHASAYWARIVAFEAPFQVMEADAEVTEPGVVRLDTRNVAAIDLTLPADLRGNSSLRIVWNGRSIAASGDGVVHLQEPGDALKPSDKRPGLEGGLSNIFTTPFAVVIGTASHDPRMRELIREKGEALATQWMGWQHVRPRVLLDTDVTPADEQRYSLLLVGGADANAVSRRLMPRLPMRVDAQSVTIGGKRFPVRGAVTQMIYPSPVQPARYVLVVAATSADGMYFWDPTGYWHTPFGYPLQQMDWTISDGRLVALPYGFGTYRAAVASGVFDRHWRLNPHYVFPGDEALRAASPSRHPPASRIAPAADLIKAATGHYLLQPAGVVLDVHGEGNDLVLVTPDGIKNVLRPEGDGMFNLGASTVAVTVDRDADGRIVGLTGNNSGTIWQAKKLD